MLRLSTDTQVTAMLRTDSQRLIATWPYNPIPEPIPEPEPDPRPSPDPDPDAGDCHAESQGSWPLPARAATWPVAEHLCMQRCLRCERCHFVSLSVRYHDCSWFEACDLHALQSRPTGFRTYELTAKTRNHSRGAMANTRGSVDGSSSWL